MNGRISGTNHTAITADEYRVSFHVGATIQKCISVVLWACLKKKHEGGRKNNEETEPDGFNDLTGQCSP